MNLYVCVLVEASKSCSDCWSAFFGACQLLARSMKSSFDFTAPSNCAYDEDDDASFGKIHVDHPSYEVFGLVEHTVLLVKCITAAGNSTGMCILALLLDFVFMCKAY